MRWLEKFFTGWERKGSPYVKESHFILAEGIPVVGYGLTRVEGNGQSVYIYYIYVYTSANIIYIYIFYVCVRR